MTISALAVLEKDVRTAVGSGAFEEVPARLDAYCRAVEELARQLPAGAAELPELQSRFAALARWVRLMATAARARFADELHQAGLVQGYLTRASDESSAVSMDL